ncbi:MAG: TetR/AcrR family transcriptional regulator [Burkholderiaceae bacterium]
MHTAADRNQGSTARERIIATAWAHFLEHGFEDARIASIRTDAGVSNGSFFHHFPTKDALGAHVYLAIVADYQASMLDVLGGPPALVESPIAIERLIRRHLAWVVTQPERAAYVFNGSRTEWADLVSDELQALNRRFLDAFEAWRLPRVESGELIDVERADFIAQLLGPAQMVCRRWLAGHDAYPPDRSADTLVACAIRGLVIDD